MLPGRSCLIRKAGTRLYLMKLVDLHVCMTALPIPEHATLHVENMLCGGMPRNCSSLYPFCALSTDLVSHSLCVQVPPGTCLCMPHGLWLRAATRYIIIVFMFAAAALHRSYASSYAAKTSKPPETYLNGLDTSGICSASPYF